MQFLGGMKTASEISDIVEQLMRLSEVGEPIFWAAERIGDGALLGAVGLCQGNPYQHHSSGRRA